jgi:protein tyrosine phosphatase (PTP) superfamily phosphohydrolase (DUF442 family)
MGNARPPLPAADHRRRGFRDWVDLMVKDHGFLRIFWKNRHQFSPLMWRSNQPSPRDVRGAGRNGIKTIINLRGPRNDGGWRLEKQACDEMGIQLIDFSVRSRDVPHISTIRNAKALFEQLELPAMIHCKSGADRAGIMAALYLLLEKQASVDEALAMLSYKYLHVREAKTGILDAFIEAYRPAQDRGVDFMTWAENELDPAAIKANFTAKGWGVRLVDNLLRRE